MPEITDAKIKNIRLCLSQCKEKLELASTIIDPYDAKDLFDGGENDPDYNADSLIYGKNEIDYIEEVLSSLPS